MLNLLEVSDGWGHLRFGTSWDGNQHAYDATVDVEKVGGPETHEPPSRDGDGPQQVHRVPDVHRGLQDAVDQPRRQEYMYWNNVETKPGEEDRGGGGKGRRLRSEGALRSARSRPPTTTTARPGSSTSTRPRSARRCAPQGTGPSTGRTGTRTRARASSRTTTTSTCRASATTAPTRRASRPARAARSSSATGRRRARRPGALPGACATASPPARTRRSYFNPKLFKSEKCIFCFPRVEKGLAPACAQQCVGRIRFVGYLDDVDGQVHEARPPWKVAIPLHPEYGTQPNVYYVPPLPGPPKFDAHGRPHPGEPADPDCLPRVAVRRRGADALAMLEARDGEAQGGEGLGAHRHAHRLQALGDVPARGATAGGWSRLVGAAHKSRGRAAGAEVTMRVLRRLAVVVVLASATAAARAVEPPAAPSPPPAPAR